MKCSGVAVLDAARATSALPGRRPRTARRVAIARSTSFAPWSKMRPAPSALWPTSLLPMSSSLGMPTAVPCARSAVHRRLLATAGRGRRAREPDRVALVVRADADAVHHAHDHRARHAGESVELAQLPIGHGCNASACAALLAWTALRSQGGSGTCYLAAPGAGAAGGGLGLGVHGSSNASVGGSRAVGKRRADQRHHARPSACCSRPKPPRHTRSAAAQRAASPRSAPTAASIASRARN